LMHAVYARWYMRASFVAKERARSRERATEQAENVKSDKRRRPLSDRRNGLAGVEDSIADGAT
jgi:hypothetical protein